MEEDIFSTKIDDLANLIEESIRATKKNVVRFIEPADGTLRRAMNRQHHIIFGRRGSGKTSLLIKAMRKPKFSTRRIRRCTACGRRHSVIRKFGICRICFRTKASNGEIPGVIKSSW